MDVFFSDADRAEYLRLLAEQGGASVLSPFLLQEEDSLTEFRKPARTGRPLGGKSFLEDLERPTGRALRPRRRGPKPSS
jgi:hypothetical protein